MTTRTETDSQREGFWQRRWSSGDATTFSWFEDVAASIERVDALGLDPATPTIDIGGGGGAFAPGLVAAGWTDVTVLDVSEHALDVTARRAGSSIDFIRADVLSFQPTRAYGLWHDRALLHFFTDASERATYVEVAASAVPVGHAIVSVFSSTGPEECSGLSVHRHSPAELAEVMSPHFAAVDFMTTTHLTPKGNPQSFLTGVFVRT